MITQSSASATIIRPDIAAGLNKIALTWPHILETIPEVKEVLLELTMGYSSIHSWVFTTKITYRFILRLDVLCTGS
jgi:hypothetical protein